MKIKTRILTALAAALISLPACSYLPADGNKTVTEQAVDSTVGIEKVGIPECDVLIDELAAFSQNPDDSIPTQIAKRAASNAVRDRLKQRIEQNQTDKKKLAQDCVQYKAQFDMIRNELNR